LNGRIVQLGQGRYQERVSATKTTRTNVVSNDIAENRDYTRQILADLGLPNPRYERVYEQQDAVQAARRIGYPVVVKPKNRKPFLHCFKTRDLRRSSRYFGQGRLFAQHRILSTEVAIGWRHIFAQPAQAGAQPKTQHSTSSRSTPIIDLGISSMTRQKRTFDRIKHRISCELAHDDQRSFGIVLDVSARSLFVRMGNVGAPPLGTQVNVKLNDPENGEMLLIARVMRIKSIRRELVVSAGGGIGLEVLSAPEPYYNLLKTLVKR
jgi:hypothetical protein